jgi:DNA-binding NtrC family response regulator
MSAAALRILVVAAPPGATENLLDRLLLRGWASYPVDSMSEAQAVLRTIQFDVVLAAERLPDGRGYDLSPVVASSCGTLLVCISLSESYLWLPVLSEGARVLGKRAINHDSLGGELEEILSTARSRRERSAAALSSQSRSKREIPPRKKDLPASSDPLPQAVSAAAVAAAEGRLHPAIANSNRVRAAK